MKTSYVVYFIKSGHNRVKIGRTQNVDERIKAIQTHSPKDVSLEFVVPCRDKAHSVYVENLVHRLFSKSRQQGEWFKYNGAVHKFLNAIKSQDSDKALDILAQVGGKSPVALKRSLSA